MLSRRLTDKVFAWLFRVFSLTGVAALGAIVIFILIQGIQPFIFSTSGSIRIFVEKFDSITVNQTVYEKPDGFIELPWNTKVVSFKFMVDGVERDMECHLNPEKNGKTSVVEPIEAGDGEVSSPNTYTYTVSFPGDFPGVKKRINVILPEAPYGILDFLGGTEWLPVHTRVFGIFTMFVGSLCVCFGALLIGVPVGILSSVFMAEFLPEKIAGLLRGGVELLAGIPSVVFGFFGLMVIVPMVKQTFKTATGNSLLSAVLVLALMILPTIIVISENVLRAVPRSRREASLSLGASKMQTAWHVVLPHAKSGVIAAIILGFSRAIGETMAVILVAGNSIQFIKSPLEGVRTLTGTIALEMGYADTRHSQMLFAIGVVLLIMVFLLNSLILFIRSRSMEDS